MTQPQPPITGLNDADCIAAVRGGDADAYGELVLRYQDRLFNTLAHLLGSADDAQDIAQDAFVQAYLKLHTFQGKSQFYTWLYRIAFNLAMSHARRRRPVTLLDGDEGAKLAEPADTNDQPEDCLLAEERAAAVGAAIAELADDHRQVVVLREIEGCDYQQIAEILKIPIGTVRSRLFRARMELKEKLAAIAQPD